jgi:ferredoxin
MESKTKLQVSVDLQKCCGAGRCVMTAPKVFDQNDEGVVILLDAEPPAAEHRAVREAATVCPGSAIFVKEIPA